MHGKIDQAAASLLAAEADGDIARGARIAAWLVGDRALTAAVLCTYADMTATALTGLTYAEAAERSRAIGDAYLGRWAADGTSFHDIADVARAAVSWTPVEGHRFTAYGRLTVAATVTPSAHLYPLVSAAARLLVDACEASEEFSVAEAIEDLGGDEGHCEADDPENETMARRALDLCLLGLPERPVVTDGSTD